MVSTAGPESAGRRARLAVTSFPEFYKQWWPPLVRCLTAQASDCRWAVDIAQDTMIAARDNWERLLTHERPDAWLFKVAIRSLRRLEARARELCLLPEDRGQAVGDLVTVALADEWIATHLDLLAALRALPRRQGEVAVLHGLAGYTFAESAQILGIAEPAARQQFSHAGDRLAELLGTAPQARLPHQPGAAP